MPAQLHLNLNLLNAGTFSSAWRWPESGVGDFLDTNFYVRAAQIAERGTFDAVFLADVLSLGDGPEHRPFQALEPTINLTSIAAATEHIGLIATASSTLNEPYNIARRFSSLDHMSGGRAGINVVTTADRQAALNFGLDGPLSHRDRYERAAEFTGVMKALWDSWDDDALVGDKVTGTFIDVERVHPVRHLGAHFSVDGALTLPRSPQGRPIIVQAGGSDDGKDFAVRHADAVFSLAHSIAEAVAFSEDLQSRARRFGRTSDILIFPGLVTIIGSTMDEARRRENELWELVSPEFSIARLAGFLQVAPEDLSLDKPLPAGLKIPENGWQSFSENALRSARAGNLTVRELIRSQGGSTSHRIFVGTPEQLADDIELWFRSGAIAGFNLMPDVTLSGLEVFVDHVVPLLRQRGIFRDAYSGKTLREHYNLPKPPVPARKGTCA